MAGFPQSIDLNLAPGIFNRQTVILASIAFFGALIVFFVMAARPQTTRKLYQWAFTRFLPHKIQTTFIELADRFMEGLSSLTRLRDILMIFFTSVVIWLLETIKYWFVMHAFGFMVSFFVLMLMNGVVNLATTLPSAPSLPVSRHCTSPALSLRTRRRCARSRDRSRR